MKTELTIVVDWSYVSNPLEAVVQRFVLDFMDSGSGKFLAKGVLQELLLLVQCEVHLYRILHHLPEKVNLLHVYVPKHHVLLLVHKTLL